jgi:hypothetical protein
MPEGASKKIQQVSKHAAETTIPVTSVCGDGSFALSLRPIALEETS